MKRCPNCQKTFDDAMRFCQTDGTPLVDDAPPADPYKTMVASKEDIQAALSSSQSEQPSAVGIGAPDDEPLEIPSAPPAANVGSEFATKLAGSDDAQVIEIPPLAEATPPEPPTFNEPSTPPPSFGSQGTPSSPFSTPRSTGAGDFPTTPPIPSPFNEQPASSFSPPEDDEPTYFEPEPAATSFPESDPVSPTPQFAEPEREQQFNPFQQQSSPQSAPIAQSEWTPPPSPTQGGPSHSQPSSTNLSTQNKTLAIISLVAGILGLTICCGSILPSLVALILGFMARGKANSNPSQFGGAGLAMGGIILGAVGLVGSIVLWVLYFTIGLASFGLQQLQ